MKRLDIYPRLFAFNIYHFGYKDKTKLAQYTNINDDKILDAIYSDADYGFNFSSGTFKWVQAFNQGKDSKKYL